MDSTVLFGPDCQMGNVRSGSRSVEPISALTKVDLTELLKYNDEAPTPAVHFTVRRRLFSSSDTW